jgi:hypothetical protein
MEIAAVLHIHRHTNLCIDTIDSIRGWVTKDVLAVVDGKYWKNWGEKAPLPALKLEGFPHGLPVAGYRNFILGLMHAVAIWPTADWYLHTEYDTLFTSDTFLEDLEAAGKRNVFCLGFDYRENQYQLPLLEAMLKAKFNGTKYLIGCCHFYKGDFLRELAGQNFFARFLNLTNHFPPGVFPGFEGFCVMEHLLPTVADWMGGGVEGLAAWKGRTGYGQHKKYPVRFRPELDWQENYPEAAIMHSIKSLNNPLRNYHRNKRIKYGRSNEQSYQSKTTYAV